MDAGAVLGIRSVQDGVLGFNALCQVIGFPKRLTNILPVSFSKMMLLCI